MPADTVTSVVIDFLVSFNYVLNSTFSREITFVFHYWALVNMKDNNLFLIFGEKSVWVEVVK